MCLLPSNLLLFVAYLAFDDNICSFSVLEIYQILLHYANALEHFFLRYRNIWDAYPILIIMLWGLIVLWRESSIKGRSVIFCRYVDVLDRERRSILCEDALEKVIIVIYLDNLVTFEELI